MEEPGGSVVGVTASGTDITELAETVIQRMIQVVGKDPGSNIPLPRDEVVALVVQCQKMFTQEPSLLELDGAVQIFGDIHGQYFDLLRLFELFGYPRGGAEGVTSDCCRPPLGPDTKFLFLGDFVDRGRYSVDCVCLIFALKIRFPQHVYLVRGNHEDEAMNSFFGFLDECRRTYDYQVRSQGDWVTFSTSLCFTIACLLIIETVRQMWRIFNECFGYLPIAAVVSKKVFCVHGGLSPYLQTLDQV